MAEVSKQLVKPGTILGITTFWFLVEGVFTLVLMLVTFLFFPTIYYIGSALIVVGFHAVNVMITREEPDRDQIMKARVVEFLASLGFQSKKYPPAALNGSKETIYGP